MCSSKTNTWTARPKPLRLDFRAVGHLSTRDVAAVLERTRDRMVKWLRRRGLLVEDSDAEGEGDGLAVLACRRWPSFTCALRRRMNRGGAVASQPNQARQRFALSA
jgi:hypothetical protein